MSAEAVHRRGIVRLRLEELDEALNLPPSLRSLAVAYCPRRQVIDVLVYGPELPEVAPGAEAVIVDVPRRTLDRFETTELLDELDRRAGDLELSESMAARDELAALAGRFASAERDAAGAVLEDFAQAGDD